MTTPIEDREDSSIRRQFSTRALLAVSALVGIYFGVWKALDGQNLSGPWLLDGVVLICAIALLTYYRRLQSVAFWILAASCLVALLLHTPSIVWDEGLKSHLAKFEAMWGTLILSTIIGILASVLYWRLTTAPRNVLWISVSLLAVILSVGMCIRSQWPGVPTDEFRYELGRNSLGPNVKIKFTDSTETFYAGGHFVYGFRGHEPLPDLSYFRSGVDYYYWVGARLRLFGFALAYVHSDKWDEDFGVGPMFVIVIPYWMMITVCLLFLAKHLRLLRLLTAVKRHLLSSDACERNVHANSEAEFPPINR